MHKILLCDFNKVTGWRVRGSSYSDNKNIRVVRIGNMQLLKICSEKQIRTGSFCNPRKVLGI